MSRKPNVSRDRAEVLARTYVEGLDLRGWRYDFVGVEGTPRDGQWGVVFDRFSPAGNLVDGPIVFLVNAASGAVCSLEDFWEQRA